MANLAKVDLIARYGIIPIFFIFMALVLTGILNAENFGIIVGMLLVLVVLNSVFEFYRKL